MEAIQKPGQLSTGLKGTRVSAFLHKISEILNNSDNAAAIRWSSNGDGILIIDEQLLSSEVLPKYFKHSNYSSFIRQLNMYDFHKLRNVEYSSYFSHPNFVRDRPDLLRFIHRKTEKKTTNKEEFTGQRKNPNVSWKEDESEEYNTHKPNLAEVIPKYRALGKWSPSSFAGHLIRGKQNVYGPRKMQNLRETRDRLTNESINLDDIYTSSRHEKEIEFNNIYIDDDSSSGMSINKEIVEENHVVQMKKTQLLCNQSYLANFPSYRE